MIFDTVFESVNTGFCADFQQIVQGINGKDGDTPVRGVDYWTEADKNEIVARVLAALPTYNGEVV